MNKKEEIELLIVKLRNMSLPAELPSNLRHLKDAYETLKEELMLAKESKNDHQYDELINAFEKNLKNN